MVAIDGPAGSGKSTTSRAVAGALGLEALDTGAMYRGVTFAVLRRGVDPRDAEAVARVAEEVELQVGERVVVDGVDATGAVRGPEVTSAVSAVAANPGVRRAMVSRQRAWVAERGGGVVEGRDIGTVVFPGAPVKVYLTASDHTRAARRQADEQAGDRGVEVETVRSDLQRRDGLDASREVAPLAAAADALVIETSGLSVDDVVARVLERAEEAGMLP